MSDLQCQLQCRGWSNLSWKLRPHSFEMFWVNSQRCRLVSHRSQSGDPQGKFSPFNGRGYDRVWEFRQFFATCCNPIKRACLCLWIVTIHMKTADKSLGDESLLLLRIWRAKSGGGLLSQQFEWRMVCRQRVFLGIYTAWCWSYYLMTVSHLMETWSVIFCAYNLWSMWNIVKHVLYPVKLNIQHIWAANLPVRWQCWTLCMSVAVDPWCHD